MGARAYRTADDESAWDRLRSELSDRVASLRDLEALVLEEPRPPRPHRRTASAPGRYVQFLREEDDLIAEVVGPAHWPSSLRQQNGLLDAGWAEPESVPAYPAPNFVRRWLPGQEGEAACAAIDALRVLGADPGGRWRWSHITPD